MLAIVLRLLSGKAMIGTNSALRNWVHACPEKDHPTYDENRRMQVSSLTILLQSRARALASK